MAVTIQIRRDNSSNWLSINPILAQGELAYELDTGYIKIGDGATTWSGLNYYTSVSGSIDHGGLIGLSDDDHSQYHTDARGDDRYYTQLQIDTISGSLHDEITAISGGGGTTDHDELSNLDYASSGHTGFQPAGDYVTDSEITTISGDIVSQIPTDFDDRYYTEVEITTISGDIVDQIPENFNDLYYTESELNAGQLDNRYYTESEITTISGDIINQIPNDYVTNTELTTTSGDIVSQIPSLDEYATESYVTTISGDIVDQIPSDFNDLYYTETELDNGQLDTRYYTESELNSGQLDDRYYTESEVDTISGSLHQEIIDATISGGGGVTDHGDLTGLLDDDHTQYHTDARGDERYYAQDQITTISGDIIDQIPTNFDDQYYTETELDAGQLDSRYYTESEITTISGDIISQIPSDYITDLEMTTISGDIIDQIPSLTGYATQIWVSDNYVDDAELTTTSGDIVDQIPSLSGYATEVYVTTISGDIIDQIPIDYITDLEITTISGDIISQIPENFDDRYYTETELDNGQLDARYYTETEVDGLIAAASGTTDHSLLSNLDYASSGHTGFQPAGDYVTDSEMTTISGDIVDQIPNLDGYATEEYVITVSGSLQSQITNVITTGNFISASGVSVGTSTVDTFGDVDGYGCRWDYVVYDENNSRAGTILSSWNSISDNIVYSDTSTDDVGDTTNIEFDVDINSDNVRLTCTVTSGTWFIKGARYLYSDNLSTISGGATDHGDLTGLANDDHTQYLNITRGDARYYTEAEVDTISGSLHQEIVDATISGGGGVSDHGDLTGLLDDDHTQYHTDARGDERYFIQDEITTISGDIVSQIPSDFDDRYYTESEIDTISGSLQDQIDTISGGGTSYNFNAINFSVDDTDVDTIQGISSTAVPLFAGLALPNTINTSISGVITKGGKRFIHDFNYGDNGEVVTVGKNIFVGEESGNFTTGSGASLTVHSSYNVGIGYKTLYSNTIGFSNVAVGYNSLCSNTEGVMNVGIGNVALNDVTTGGYNVAIGGSALRSVTTNNGMVAVGFGALSNSVSGSQNIAIGYTALNNSTAGNYNTVVGDSALVFNVMGSSNTAVGRSSMANGEVGNYNTAIGEGTLFYNESNYNTAVGYNSLYNNTSGNENIAIGFRALYTSTSGNKNIAIGYESLYSNTDADYNTAVGYNTLHNNTEGQYNTAFGSFALDNNTLGDGNLSFGHNSLTSNITGAYNVAVGTSTLVENETGVYNVAVGYGALYHDVNSYNVGIGYYALFNITSGNNDTGVGRSAGNFIYNGSSPNQTSSNSVYLGSFTKALSDGNTNEIVIGYNTTGSGSNTAVLGNDSITDTYLKGDVHCTSLEESNDGWIHNYIDTISGTLESNKNVLEKTTTSGNASGLTIPLTANESLVFGEVIYICSNGEIGLADATQSGTMPCVGIISDETVASGSNANVMTHGSITNSDWSFSPGQKLYVSVNAGDITNDLSTISGSGEIVQIIGISLTSDTIFFNPSLATVTLS